MQTRAHYAFSPSIHVTIEGGHLLTLLLILAAILSFFSGSALVIFVCITVLAIKIYPVLILLLVALAVAYFLLNYTRK